MAVLINQSKSQDLAAPTLLSRNAERRNTVMRGDEKPVCGLLLVNRNWLASGVSVLVPERPLCT